ncbi:diguanylate cyclase domain-containing protein [Bacillus piscicola]|uniref:sensor domain-containing diguanylate cyclase n=1 Tax=Bacillus piscicola TaxID=1632684 RepID=UPI001F092F4F|nr:diguanylate cyclase [Bacillus piscicola]
MDAREEQTERIDLLMRVTKKFHISMHASDVVKEIIFVLQEAFPSSLITLHLSQDWEVKNDLPGVNFMYGFENIHDQIQKTYVTGTVQFEETSEPGTAVLYVPLRGRQGVYGVLQILGTYPVMSSELEQEFIIALADLGGNALENRELYEQSRTLVKDLQLLNETSRLLNSHLRIDEIINSMRIQINKIVPHGKVVFVLLDETAKVQDLNDPFLKETKNFEAALKISKHFEMKGDAFFISELTCRPEYTFTGYHSLIAVPMMQSGKLKGSVIILGKEPRAFTFHQFKLLQSLVEHSTLAFMNAALHERLEKMVITDQLTGLYSRHYLEECINEALATDSVGTLLLFDIDDFKEVNDTFGHQTGDQIIIQVSGIIQANIRCHDIAARWGGEELAVYLPNCLPDAGEMVARRISEKVAACTRPRVTMSCGVACWEKERDQTLSSLFRDADQAMYEAKNQGKNQVLYKGIPKDFS